MKRNYKKYFVTGNNNKFNEIKLYIPELRQLKIDNLFEIQSLNLKDVIEAKLIAAKNSIDDNNYLLLVEDTGLYLKALNGFPGPLIKFFLKSIGNDGIFNICKKFNNYQAKAITSFGIYNSETHNISFYSASINGLIASPRGSKGFGWDRIFIPNGSEKTFAEMNDIIEKNKYSMRYKAIKKILKKLKEL